MTTLTDQSESAVLSRLIERKPDELTPEAARFFLSLNFSHEERSRMNDLAAKAREGRLIEEEKLELDRYLHVGDLLALWHSKARQVLKRSDRG